VRRPTPGQLGMAIRLLREERKLSIEDLGGESGIYWTSVSRIENRRQIPRWDTVVAIAAGLDVEIGDLARLAAEQSEPKDPPGGKKKKGKTTEKKKRKAPAKGS
jgi:transcriptional regulator with XRE-family HTH domain